MPDLLSGLNPEQTEAVLHSDGPLLVLAGAGSGKTRVITHRLAHRLTQIAAATGAGGPTRALALTFTNRAAREMRERVEQLIPVAPGNLFVGTFHALGLRLLRRHGEAIGLTAGFAVLDRTDSLKVVGELLKELQADEARMPPRRALSLLSRARNNLTVPEPGSLVAEVGTRYRARLARMNALDFDDLLAEPLRLLGEHPSIAARERPATLLVDEFQDTNPAQARLIELLWPVSADVCVVGDEDQSIYAFRGAALENILGFEKRHPGTRVIRLERNYRSTAAILGAASALVSRNEKRLGKQLHAESAGGAPVRVIRYPSPEDEARGIAKQVMELAGRHGRGEIGVLYRTNAQSRLLEEELLAHDVPYVIVKGLRFYERREVKDVLAYLRLIANATDDLAFERVINVPARGIGAAAMDELRARAAERGSALLAAGIELAASGSAIGRRIAAFTSLVSRLRVRAGERSPEGVLDAVLAESGYRDLLAKEDSGQSEARLDNVLELRERMAQSALPPGLDSLQSVLDDLALASEPGGGEGGAVSLLTLHNAKGLEFKAVVIAGVEEGLLPHGGVGSGDDDDGGDVEEERRLLYVGMTRAREELILSAASGRRLWGEGGFTVPSRFLLELGGRGVRHEGVPGPALPSQPAAAVAASAPTPAFQRPAPRTPTSPAPARAPGRPPDWMPDRVAPMGGAVPAAGPFPIGGWVKHPAYGEGIILEREGGGDALKLAVRFTTGVRKKFQAKFAGLQELRRKQPGAR